MCDHIYSTPAPPSSHPASDHHRACMRVSSSSSSSCAFSQQPYNLSGTSLPLPLPQKLKQKVKARICMPKVPSSISIVSYVAARSLPSITGAHTPGAEATPHLSRATQLRPGQCASTCIGEQKETCTALRDAIPSETAEQACPPKRFACTGPRMRGSVAAYVCLS